MEAEKDSLWQHLDVRYFVDGTAQEFGTDRVMILLSPLDWPKQIVVPRETFQETFVQVTVPHWIVRYTPRFSRGWVDESCPIAATTAQEAIIQYFGPNYAAEYGRTSIVVKKVSPQATRAWITQLRARG